jgi:hypothetical protein
MAGKRGRASETDSGAKKATASKVELVDSDDEVEDSGSRRSKRSKSDEGDGSAKKSSAGAAGKSGKGKAAAKELEEKAEEENDEEEDEVGEEFEVEKVVARKVVKVRMSARSPLGWVCASLARPARRVTFPSTLSARAGSGSPFSLKGLTSADVRAGQKNPS